ncbi:MAG: hypothetical protein IJ087_00360 [Eggerthellaceae bacterium]|nr:hypothetical protein [Eggerthellaceae bacterium]
MSKKTLLEKDWLLRTRLESGELDGFLKSAGKAIDGLRCSRKCVHALSGDDGWSPLTCPHLKVGADPTRCISYERDLYDDLAQAMLDELDLYGSGLESWTTDPEKLGEIAESRKRTKAIARKIERKRE